MSSTKRRISCTLFSWSMENRSPKRWNPYWSKTARDSFDVDAIERQYRVMKGNGKILETTITASQVITMIDPKLSIVDISMKEFSSIDQRFLPTQAK